MSSETLVLSSEVSKGIYPDNNLGCFTTDLCQPLIFGSDGYVKINDLAYVPGSWDYVRENSNEITLKMRGYPVWGLVPATIYHSGEIRFEGGTRKNYRRNSNRAFRYVHVYRATITLFKNLGMEKAHHTSDWMPGKAFDVNDKNPKEPPIFRTATDGDLPRYSGNDYSLGIQMLGKVAKNNEWQISKGYLPCTYYHLFADFQLAFVKCVNDTIEKMFVEANAYPTIHEILKIKLGDFNGFRDAAIQPKSVWCFYKNFNLPVGQR